MILDNKKVAILCAICLIVGAVVGGLVTYKCFPRTVVEYKADTVSTVQEKVVLDTNTEVKYVPKEIDPDTGEKEKTDVEANINQPTVNVKVNGMAHDFKLEQKENQKFENGKVVLDQNTTLKLDVKTNDPKLVKVDAFCGEGYGLSINYKKLTVDIDLTDIKHPKADRIKYRLMEF